MNSYIVLAAGILICGVLAVAIATLQERRRIRLVVEAAAEHAGVPLQECVVRLGIGWPFFKTVAVSVVVRNQRDAPAMQQAMMVVWAWLDERYGIDRDD